MARVAINTGGSPNDGLGDSLRSAGGKINDNFLELYTYLGAGSTDSLVAPVWQVTNAGIHTQYNVGLGTTNPRFALEVGSVGSSGTSLYVNGDARITGILTVGSSSISLDGDRELIKVGTGITIDGAAGIISASSFIVNGTVLTGIAVTSITAGENISINQSTGNVVISGLANTTNLNVDKAVFSGIATFQNDIDFIGDSYNVFWDKSLNGGSLKFNDNARISIGSSDDLQIYNDGSFNFLLGSINLDDQLIISSDSKVVAKFPPVVGGDSNVELYSNNSKRFETTNTGAIVSGICTADFFSGIGSEVSFLNASNIAIGTLSNSRLPGDISVVNLSASSDLTVSGDANVSGVSTFNNDVIFKGQGAVNAYWDAVALNGAFYINNSKLVIGESGDPYFEAGTGSSAQLSNGGLVIDAGYLLIDAANGDNVAKFVPTVGGDNNVELYSNNSKKFETLGAGVTVTGTTFTNQLSVSGISTIQSLNITGTGVTSYLNNSTIENYSETIVNVGNVGSSYTYTLGSGNYFIATLDQTSTFDFDASLAPTGSVSFIIQLKNGTGGPFSITWPASVKWPAGITPTRTTTDGRTDIWTFITNDGGTNWIGNLNIVNYNI